MSVTAEAYRLRKIAETGHIGQRHSSFDLYDLLGHCMALAQRCAKGESYEELRLLVAQQAPVGKRRYVERASDEFIHVCRFVFSNETSASACRANASRYAHAIRQAASLGIASDVLAKHLRENGGINALFLRRPLAATTVTTKCLSLTTGITVPKDKPVALTIKRTNDNRYDVLSCEVAA